MKCPRCGFNDDPVNEPEYSDDVCEQCEEDERVADWELVEPEDPPMLCGHGYFDPCPVCEGEERP